MKVKIGTYSISLEYKPNQKQKKIKIVEYPRMSINIEFHRTSEFKANLIVHRTLLENTYIIEINEGFLREKSKRERELFAFILSDQIIKIIAKEFFKNIRKCYYLPAARSGILQGHKSLVASIVKTAPYIGLERLEIPKFSGVVSDFIASIITLPEKKSRLYKLAEQFENELIEGHILVKKTEEFRYPEIEYLFQKTEIPLQRASSTVSEMAPLFLYLKYLVGPGSLLIIEEPEAHLHPANQRILAKYLVRLIREGVNILITTHSEYLLEQLNNFILLSKVSPEVRVRKYNYEENDYLLNNEVGVYIFKYNEDLQGYIIDSLQITGEEGIPQDDFLRVHEALYEESLQIRKSIESEMGK